MRPGRALRGCLVLLLAGAPAAGDEAPPRLHFLYTEHVGRLTGTTRNPLVPLGLLGTDLGSSFVRDGKVVFLFGDATVDDMADYAADSAATAPLTLPDDGTPPKLTWVAQANGRFQQIRMAGIDLGSFNVPVEGVPFGAKTYLFFTTGWSDKTHRHTSSVLAHCDGLDFGFGCCHQGLDRPRLGITDSSEGWLGIVRCRRLFPEAW